MAPRGSDAALGFDVGAYEYQEPERYKAVKDNLRQCLSDVGNSTLVLIALVSEIVNEHQEQPASTGRE